MARIWFLLGGLVAVAAIALGGSALVDRAHAAQVPNWAGTWSGTWNVSEADFTVMHAGDALPCDMNFTVDGTALGGTWHCTKPADVTYTVAGTINGNTATGTATGSFSGFTLPWQFSLTISADGKTVSGSYDIEISLGGAKSTGSATRTGGEPLVGGTAPVSTGTTPSTGGPLGPADSAIWWLIPAGALLLSVGAATVYATRRS